MDISQITIAKCRTHHLYRGEPIYNKRFKTVEKFHAPGFAPVTNNLNLAYHINLFSDPIYEKTFEKTFGFYCGLAAVMLDDKYFHIDKSGFRAYEASFEWAGNYQENLCVVKLQNMFFHINKNGERIYDQYYDYVGDFRDGLAIVYRDNKATYIDTNGNYLHEVWFEQLTQYHKSIACARDEQGWFHINMDGKPLYCTRYRMIEPFYNNLARVETDDGKILQIDHDEEIITEISDNSLSVAKSNISKALVGFWNTQILYTAACIGIFDKLPSDLEDLSKITGIPTINLSRFLRALEEIEIVKNELNYFSLTVYGSVFANKLYLQDAAIMWGRVASQNWGVLPQILKRTTIKSHPSFKDIEENTVLREIYQNALDGYLYEDLDEIVYILNTSKLGLKVLCLGKSSRILAEKIQRCNVHFLSEGDSSKCLDMINKPFDSCIFLKFLHHHDDNVVSEYLSRLKTNNVKMIFIIETILLPNKPIGGVLDINMLVESGGKLRSMEELIGLLSTYNYNVDTCYQINPYLNIISATRVNDW